MATTPALLSRHAFDARWLAADLPPRLSHPNKQIVYDIACPPGCVHSGTIEFTRWKGVPLPSEFNESSRPTTFEPREEYFGYEPATEGSFEWYLNFANQSVFSAYGGALFAQDEMQVAEHPGLGSLRRALLRADITPLTVENGEPTPILVTGVERRCRIAIDPDMAQGRPHGLYGVQFARASADAVAQATQPIVPPTTTNIIAMEAPSYGTGRYQRRDIDFILATVVTAFAAASGESRRINPSVSEIVIHTGFWGCGAYGGNRVLMALLQLFGARLARVDRLVFHAGDAAAAKSLIDAQAIERDLGIDTGRRIVADVLDQIESRGFEWGVSDGN